MSNKKSATEPYSLIWYSVPFPALFECEVTQMLSSQRLKRYPQGLPICSLRYVLLRFQMDLTELFPSMLRHRQTKSQVEAMPHWRLRTRKEPLTLFHIDSLPAPLAEVVVSDWSLSLFGDLVPRQLSEKQECFWASSLFLLDSARHASCTHLHQWPPTRGTYESIFEHTLSWRTVPAQNMLQHQETTQGQRKLQPRWCLHSIRKLLYIRTRIPAWAVFPLGRWKPQRMRWRSKKRRSPSMDDVASTQKTFESGLQAIVSWATELQWWTRSHAVLWAK